jgi:hypothetical protein
MAVQQTGGVRFVSNLIFKRNAIAMAFRGMTSNPQSRIRPQNVNNAKSSGRSPMKTPRVLRGYL